jgi:hypothetical protein
VNRRLYMAFGKTQDPVQGLMACDDWKPLLF